MNKLMLIVVALGSMVTLVGGCMDSRIGKADALQTVAYSSGERGDLIAGSMETDWKEMNDDVDSVLMLRPCSNMTIWHVR